MSLPRINLDGFTPEQKEACAYCGNFGATHLGTVPIPICELAQLEQTLGRRPKYREASQEGLEVEAIPAECPNKYRDWPSREIR